MAMDADISHCYRVPTAGLPSQSMFPDKAPQSQTSADQKAVCQAQKSGRAEASASSLLAWRAEEPSSANSEVDSSSCLELPDREG